MVNPELEHTDWEWEEVETVLCDLCGGNSHRRVVEENGFWMVRCRDCGLVFCNPRPTPDEMTRFYADYFQPESEDLWEEQMRRPFQKEGVDFLNSVMKPDRVLDVGCAHGFFLRMMRETGWECVGVEPSPDAARYASEKLNLEVHSGHVEDAPFARGSFGAATLWYVLEHVPNPTAVLSHAARLLRPGGYLILRVPNANVKVDRMLALLGNFGRRFFLINPPRHLYDYNTSTIRKLLRKTGFKVLKMQNAIPRSAGGFLERFRRHAWFWKAELERFLTRGQKLTGSSITVYARKRKQS
ncbi:MAG: class I SAM-dependent methyltransferase [Planctomycetes bacterium]|nr:class I SAM-dependent methyltransferase [Planctomycetota bacterium]